MIVVDLREETNNGCVESSVREFGSRDEYYLAITDNGDASLVEQYEGYKVCLVEGGFKALHDLLLKNKISIPNHNL